MAVRLSTYGIRYASAGRYTQHSISMPAPAGSAATPTVVRAGRWLPSGLLVQRVHRREVPQIGEEDPDLRDVGPARPGSRTARRRRSRAPAPPRPPRRRRRASRSPDRGRPARQHEPVARPHRGRIRARPPAVRSAWAAAARSPRRARRICGDGVVPHVGAVEQAVLLLGTPRVDLVDDGPVVVGEHVVDDAPRRFDAVLRANSSVSPDIASSSSRSYGASIPGCVSHRYSSTSSPRKPSPGVFDRAPIAITSCGSNWNRR